MIESHINEGRQDVPEDGPEGLRWGVSITDACVDWERTAAMLDRLNEVRRDSNFTGLELMVFTGC